MSEEKRPEETLADKVTHIFDPLLESHKTANMLIIIFLVLAAIPITAVFLISLRLVAPGQIGQIVPGARSSIHYLGE